MRSTSAGRFATLLFFCAVIVQAYPGGQFVRSFIEATSTVSSTEQSSTFDIHNPMDHTSVQSTLTGRVESLTSTSTSSMSPSPSPSHSSTSTSASVSMPTQAEPRGLIDALPLLSPQGGVYLEESPDGNEVDYEDDDCDGEDDYLEAREVHYGSYSNLLDSIMTKLDEIHTLLQARKEATPMVKRQFNDVLDQEQAYGNQGKHLTQEQKDSIMSLVKGMNGYQASLEGVGNTDQSGKETWQQTNPLIDSVPLSAALTPNQIAELMGIIGLLEGQRIPSKPSTSTIGSQVGESASQVGWMTPGDGSIRDAGYTVQSTANLQKYLAATDPQKLMIMTRLEQLKQQERDLMQQLSMMKPGQGNGRSFKSISEDGFHQLSQDEQAELTSMLFEGQGSSTSLVASIPTFSASPTSP